MSPRRAREAFLGFVFASALHVPAFAGESDRTPAQQLEPVTVTAARQAEAPSETPAAIDSVGADTLEGNRLGVNLSEMLSAVPGTLVRDRENYAQDEQASIRGFGTRAPFGIVGLKIYVDGIPATRPDGQGQVSQLNLESAERIEVLRGPFSALYGNSSGGVIQVFTAPGRGALQVGSEQVLGSYGQWRGSAQVQGAAGDFGYHLDYTHFQTDGTRDHASARRESGNARWDWQAVGGTHLTLLANTVSIPEAEDPLGLTRAQFQANPRAASPSAATYDTRKSVEQTQGALVLEQPLPFELALHATAYFGHRAVRQFLAVTPAAEADPRSSGGVVGLGGDYGGGELRLGGQGFGVVPHLSWVAGFAYDRQNQRRRGYENFINGAQGAPGVGSDLGVQGALRRDEDDHVEEYAPYLQGFWDFLPDWRLQLGVRHSEVRFVVDDHYVATGNPDDGGHLRYAATTPVAGLLYRLTPHLHVYGSFGEGFDSPTFNELAYRPDGGSGLNTDLHAARTDSGELGLKYRIDAVQLEAATFESLTRDDLVIDVNQGGRTTYRNAARSRRRGMEAGATLHLAAAWRVQLAATYLDATNREPYLTCATSPCATPNVEVAAGDRIAGVAPLNLFAALRWGADTGWNAGIETTYLQRVPADSANREAAPDYGLIALDGGYVWQREHWRLRAFLRLENLLDADYAGSLILNDGRSQFYEPGPGRSVFGGLEARWH